MDKNVYRPTMQKVAEIEKEYGDLTNFAILNTFESERHKMRMEKDIFSNTEMSEVYQELSELELADLLDFQNMAGSFDGEYS